MYEFVRAAGFIEDCLLKWLLAAKDLHCAYLVLSAMSSLLYNNQKACVLCSSDTRYCESMKQIFVLAGSTTDACVWSPRIARGSVGCITFPRIERLHFGGHE